MARLRVVERRSQHLAWLMTGPLGLLTITIGIPLANREPIRSADLPAGLLFAALFALTTATVLHLELNRHAMILSVTEIPLLLALFYLPPALVIITRLIGLIVVQAWQRYSIVKLCFNVALLGLATSVACLVVVALGLRPNDVGPGTWAVLGLAVGTSTLISLSPCSVSSRWCRASPPSRASCGPPARC